MSKTGYVDLQETSLSGPHGLGTTLKIGEKFCWINPELEEGTAAAAARRMIKEYGAGPFVCQKITKVPVGRIMLSFIDDNSNMREITSEYFTKYE